MSGVNIADAFLEEMPKFSERTLEILTELGGEVFDLWEPVEKHSNYDDAALRYRYNDAPSFKGRGLFEGVMNLRMPSMDATLDVFNNMPPVLYAPSSMKFVRNSKLRVDFRCGRAWFRIDVCEEMTAFKKPIYWKYTLIPLEDM